MSTDNVEWLRELTRQFDGAGLRTSAIDTSRAADELQQLRADFKAAKVLIKTQHKRIAALEAGLGAAQLERDEVRTDLDDRLTEVRSALAERDRLLDELVSWSDAMHTLPEHGSQGSIMQSIIARAKALREVK